jgi:hypothetical protein
MLTRVSRPMTIVAGLALMVSSLTSLSAASQSRLAESAARAAAAHALVTRLLGHVSRQTFREMPLSQQQAYANGLTDGLLGESLALGSMLRTGVETRSCIASLTDDQLVEIVARSGSPRSSGSFLSGLRRACDPSIRR